MYPGPIVSPRATTRSTVMQLPHVAELSRISTVAVLSCSVVKSLWVSETLQPESPSARSDS